jgi:hypothetical protein
MNKLQNQNYLPLWTQWALFLLILLAMGWYYDFHKILFLGPQSIHFWRQVDCLSFTLNFMMEDRALLNPAIHYIAPAGHGEVVTDFPIIFYLVGNIWKITGHQEWIFRLIIFLVFTSGISFLFFALKDWFRNLFWALFLSLLLFTSPVIAYYSSNFVMNMPAFSFALMGLSSFYWFIRTEKTGWLWLSMGFYLIGGLIKIPALMTFVVILFIYLTDVLGIIKYKLNGPVFKQKIIQGLPLLFVIAGIGIWIMFLNRYNEGNKGMFLAGIFPIWELTWPEIKKIIDAFTDYWYKQYFHLSVHIASIIAFFWVLWNYRKLSTFEKVFIIILPTGVIMFLALWFQALPHHDYYLTNTYILLIITWAMAIKVLIEHYPRVSGSYFFRILFVLLFAFNAQHTKEEISIRYWGWWNTGYLQKYEPLRELKPMLRDAGVNREDTIIAMGDEIPNSTLYLLDVKGWSNYGGHISTSDSTGLAHLIQKGAKYMVFLDTIWLNKDFVRPFTHDLLLEHKSIKVFDLTDHMTRIETPESMEALQN